MSHTGPDIAEMAVENKGAASVRALRRRRWFLIAIVCGVVAWPSYQGWRRYREHSFSSGCLSARGAQDWRRERELAQQWIDWDPASGTAWLHAAEAAQGLGDLPELAVCLGNVPASDPRAIEAYLAKANLEWSELNQPDDGLAMCQRIIDLDPSVMEAHARIISFYAINLQQAEMLAAIRRAIDEVAEPREAYVYLVLADQLSLTNGRDMNSRWLASNPESARFKVGLAVHTAMAAAQNADAVGGSDELDLNQEALRQLDWFLDTLPNDPVLLAYLLGRAVDDGDVGRVEELLQRVDENTATDHMIWVCRGWYHSINGEDKEADEAFQRALSLHPLSPRAHTEYAKFLRRAQPERVEDAQRLANLGNELRAELLQIPNATAVTDEQLQKIHEYAVQCGDRRVADALGHRLASIMAGMTDQR